MAAPARLDCAAPREKRQGDRRIAIRAITIALAALGLASAPGLAQSLAWERAGDIARAEARLSVQPGAARAVWNELAAAGPVRVEPHPFRPDRRLLTFVFDAPPGARRVRLDTVLAEPYARQPVRDYVEDFTLPMRRLARSDIWTVTIDTPDTAIAAYSLLVDMPDGAALRLGDNANPARLEGENGEALFIIGRAPDQRWSLARRDRTYPEPEFINVQSARLGGEERVTLYRAPDGDAASPVLIIQDSFLWSVRAPAGRIAANLAADGRIPPVHVVLVDSVDAQSAAHAYGREGDWIADDLLPALAAYGLTPERRHVAVAGASRRGLAAARAALDRPDAIGAALSLSGSFYWAPPGEAPEWLARSLRPAGPDAPRLFLAAGSLETVVTEANAGHVMLAANRNMAAALEDAGYETALRIYAGGHDIAGWRGALARGLVWLWGADTPSGTAGGETPGRSTD